MSNISRYWQEEVGGPLVKAKCSTHPWQNRAFWRRSLTVFILQRDIICKICNRAASTCVDHIVPFISPQGVVSWERFKDPLNLQGLCQPCHSRKTATEDGGFGHSVQKVKTLTTAPAPTGTSGKQFSSGSVGNQKLDAAIGTPDELAELLSGIPK